MTVLTDYQTPDMALQLMAGRYLSLPVSDSEAQWHILPRDNQSPADTDADCLSVETACGRLLIGNATALITALTGVNPDAGEADRKHWLTLMALTRLPAPVMKTLGWVSLVNTPDTDHSGITLPWLLRQGELTLTGSITATVETWQQWLDQADWQSSPDAPTPAPLDVDCQAGYADLPVSTWQALRVGDLITLETCWFDHRGLGAIPLAGRWLKLQYQATTDGVRLQLLGWETPAVTEPEATSHCAPDATDAPPEEDMAGVTPEQPVRLSFSLGDFRLPPDQWQDIADNSVIALPFSQASRGTLRVGGQSVGHGELVTVNDRLAVQILQLWRRHG